MDAQKFGLFIQERRKELGMTQSELAQRLHVTDKAISRWERAVGFPDIKLLEPLAAALEISLTELLHSEKITMQDDPESLEEQAQRLFEEQKKLSWQRRVILYLGYAAIVSMSFVLIRISHHEALQGGTQRLVYAIALIGAFWGSRALEFIVGRFWLKSKPWGIWHNYYTWITALVMLVGFVVVKFNYKLPDPWNLMAVLGGAALMIAGWIYYAFKEEEKRE